MKPYFKLFLFLFVFLSSSSIFSQQINFDSDTLFFEIPDTEYKLDTLLIWNTGTEILIIDSVFSLSETYGYKLNIESEADSVYYYIGPGRWPFHYEINPLDSSLFIIESPDLCCICKVNQTQEYFEDTLVFISNSIENDSVNIFAHGFGLSDIIQESETEIVESFTLYQNYPNPFNPKTTVKFSIPKPSIVTLILYNSLGQKVNTLFSGRLNRGIYRTTLSATKIPSGTYYYEMIANGTRVVKKCTVLK